MEIRYLSETDDRMEINRIYEESWRYAYRGIIPQDYLDAIPKGNLTKVFDIPGWQTMVCLEEGKHIGTSSFCKSRLEQYPDAGEIISLYFLPNFIGKGYGCRLLETVFDELKKHCYQEVFLWVLEENARARTFYENCGFSKTDDYLNDTIGGKELREVRYVYSQYIELQMMRHNKC